MAKHRTASGVTGRRGLLPGFSRLPGSAKRVRTPSGSIISDRAYHGISAASSHSGRDFERVLAQHKDVQFARDASGISGRQFEAYRRATPSADNPFKKVGGRYVFEKPKTHFHAFMSETGFPQYNVAFSGDNLREMQELRKAIDRRDQAALNAWKRRHPNGITDRYGRVHNPETSLRKRSAALKRMSPAERANFASKEHYATEDKADAA
jgi:hypothetical protein